MKNYQISPKSSFLTLICSICALFSPLFVFSQVKISLEKVKATYDVNEPAKFKISSDSGGEGTYDLYYDVRDPRTIFKSGKLKLAAGGETTVTWANPEPGFVFLKATINGVSQIKAIAFDPLSIKPFDDEPSDFDAFWQKQKADLAAIPMNPVLNQTQTLPNGSKLYSLQLGNVDGRKVYGYLTVPAGTGKFPAVLVLPPFGDSPFPSDGLTNSDFSEKGNAISLLISVHNAPPNTVDPKSYQPDILTDPAKMYNRWMVLGGLRALEYLVSRSDFNGSLGVCGNSQGGGLAIMVAGLDKRVNAVLAANPAHCEHQGWRFKKANGFPMYLKRAYENFTADTTACVKAVKYHDAVNFLKRYSGPLWVLAGYTDDVAPAATVLAACGQHRGPSVIVHEREMGHNYPWNEYWQGRFTFFEKYLTGFKNTTDYKKNFSVNAGDDQLDASDKPILRGSVKSDNANLTTRWTKIEGPGDVVFDDATALTTAAKFSQPGKYVIKLTAFDDYTINDSNDAKYLTAADYTTVNIAEARKNPQTTDPQNEDLIKIRPNPTFASVKISWDSTLNYKLLRVVNPAGKLLITKDLDINKKSTEIDLYDSASGLYFIIFENAAGEILTKKLVKISFN